MTQAECLKKTGVAYGVIEDNGDINWYPDYVSGEMARYQVTKTAEDIAESKKKRLDALKKGREVKAQKRAGILDRQKTPCPGGCGYMIAMCACPPIAKVNERMLGKGTV
jgi:hypothetical protein